MPVFMQQLGVGDVDHGDSRLTRWLRARWFSLGAVLALAEGILVVAHALPKLIAMFLALALLAAYFTANRRSFPPAARVGARIVALSQILVLFVPILLFVVTAAAIVLLAIIGVIALSALLRERH